MRRHVRGLLFGVGFLFLISPGQCLFNYCARHSFNPPVCQQPI